MVFTIWIHQKLFTSGCCRILLTVTRAGLVECFVMCIALALAEAFTLYVLSKMAERYQGKTYGSMVRKALGRKLSAGLSDNLIKSINFYRGRDAYT